MFITEDEREQIARDLETMNRGHWLQLESQVHYHGGEANFWFSWPVQSACPSSSD